MKRKWIYFAIVLIALTGCSRIGSTDTKMSEDDDFKIYEKDLTPLNTILLNPTEALETEDAGEDTVVLNEEMDHVTDRHVETLYFPNSVTDSEISDIEKFTESLEEINTDLIEAWDNNFYTLYQDMVEHVRNDSDREDLRETVGDIEALCEEYNNIENDLNEVDIPFYLPQEIQDHMDKVMKEVQKSIDNRSLALIELKGMDSEGDVVTQDELINVHTENSNTYLEQADSHLLEFAAE